VEIKNSKTDILYTFPLGYKGAQKPKWKFSPKMRYMQN
jgi:hypothetical protein